MKGWWDRLRWQANEASDYEEVFHVWRDTWKLDAVAARLQGKHYCQIAARALVEEQGIEESCFTNAPFVRMLLRDHEDDYMLHWYLDTFLFGKLAPTDRPQAPYIKLDMLLRLAQYRRGKWIYHLDVVLTGDKCRTLHKEWKTD